LSSAPNRKTVAIVQSGKGHQPAPRRQGRQGAAGAPGWHADVNGDSATVRRADYNLRTVAIPSGPSVVKLDYVPPGLFAGAALSLASLLGAPLILLVGAFRRRRRTGRVYARQRTGCLQAL
jgi:hypothetical protein